MSCMRSNLISMAVLRQRELTLRGDTECVSDGRYDEAESQILEVFETRKQTLGP
jgi:hypothetical protein